MKTPTENVKSLTQLQKEEPDHRAIAEYERVLADNPAHVESLLGTARAQMRLREYENALQTIRKVLLVAPDEAEVQFRTGWIYYDLKQDARAVECFRAAVSLKPDEAKYHASLGYCLDRQSPEEALAHTEAAYRFDPQSLGSHARFSLWLTRIFAGYGPNLWLARWGWLALAITLAGWAMGVPTWLARLFPPSMTRGLGAFILVPFMSAPYVAAIGVQLRRRRYRRALWAFVLWALWGCVLWLLPLW